MKNLSNFAAQQLTKKQMNEVKGGAVFECHWKGGMTYITERDFGQFIREAPDGATCKQI